MGLGQSYRMRSLGKEHQDGAMIAWWETHAITSAFASFLSNNVFRLSDFECLIS